MTEYEYNSAERKLSQFFVEREGDGVLDTLKTQTEGNPRTLNIDWS